MEETTYAAPPVAGYRNLTQTEIDLMNTIKTSGIDLQRLIDLVQTHVQQNIGSLSATEDNPARWISIARTHLQQGLMALTRAVARPTSF